MRFLAVSLVLALTAAGPLAALAGETKPKAPFNGFDLSKLAVPKADVIAGGPPRDQIRSVDEPKFVPPQEATWAPPYVGVVGVAVGDVARAYPIQLLEFHQIVNDELDGVPVAITYDPLTEVAEAWQRKVAGQTLQFGVSGLVYASQFLLYDRQTESLWPQYEGRAISGPLVGEHLVRIQVRQEPLGVWFQRHPNTTVLTRPERKRLDYRYSPYQAYWIDKKVLFPVRARDDRFHPKEEVLGVEVDGKTRAYLGSLVVAEGGRIVDDFEGRKIHVEYDRDSATFVWDAPPDVRVDTAYWFAWKSFHPDTEVWHDPDAPPSKPPGAK